MSLSITASTVDSGLLALPWATPLARASRRFAAAAGVVSKTASGAMRIPAESVDFRPRTAARASSPVTTPIQDRLDAFRKQDRVQAGSLIISVFGDAVLPRGGRIWLGSLIRLLEPLGLNERLVRTSVFRLARDEWLVSEPCGRRTDYMLTPSGLQRIVEG